MGENKKGKMQPRQLGGLLNTDMSKKKKSIRPSTTEIKERKDKRKEGGTEKGSPSREKK